MTQLLAPAIVTAAPLKEQLPSQLKVTGNPEVAAVLTEKGASP